MRTIKSILSKRKRVLRRSTKRLVKFKKNLVVEIPIPKRGKSKPVKKKLKILNKKIYIKKEANRRSSRFSRKKNDKPITKHNKPK